MDDRQIARTAKKIKELEEKVGVVEARIKRMKQQILEELESRGTKMVKHQGAQITYVAPEQVIHRIDEYKKYVSGGLYRQISQTKEVLNELALIDLIQQGKIKPEVVAKCSEVKKSKPHVRITLYDEEN